ncbi:tyrosine-type recombinase/integrase (plasmid) [Alcaligenes faecalis]|uniref:tyrosine-type recombinase/integrase n=1 Tax=Alcaligenes faecalis TaxID=511 RepID=UPI000F65D459|nr:tyrosine-type recombinase/integrase [Alcaligenes faecalis]QHS38468.1 tyrosine-type recombinase/integrase [Alcaligenes faecalis]RSE57603.1 hypothetical protein EGT81_19395 [Alcaligenes faecalis]
MENAIALSPNLHPSHALGPVTDDWIAIDVWISHLRLRPLAETTLRSYESELAKFRWYCEHLRRPTPRSWNVQDAVQFVTWLQEEVQHHISARGIAQDDPLWTPFKSIPSKTSIATTLKVINALYNFWVSAGYVPRNPLMGIGREATRRQMRKVKSLAPQFMEAVIRHMESTVTTRPIDFLQMIRNRFVLVLLERTGLRANETISADMDDIEPVTDPQTGHTYWRLNVRFAKGGKQSSVLLDDVVLEHLRVYRQAFGFSDMPTGNEKNVALILSVRTQPLVRSNGTTYRYSTPAMRHFKSWRPIRRRQTLWDIVKREFDSTALSMREKGYQEQADQLLQASTHWLRHTFGTRLVQEGHDLRLVAQLMRHENIRNTMIYTQQEFLDIARAMHAATAPNPN